MKKANRIVVKKSKKDIENKEPSNSSLVISANKLDMKLKSRAERKASVEEFTEWQ